jgi:hypothetical protein
MVIWEVGVEKMVRNWEELLRRLLIGKYFDLGAHIQCKMFSIGCFAHLLCKNTLNHALCLSALYCVYMNLKA